MIKMINELKLNRVYVNYQVYSVVKLKDKYGFRIKFEFNDGSTEIRQTGGFLKKKDANVARDQAVSELMNHTYVLYPRVKFEDYMNYWLYTEIKSSVTYNTYLSYRNVVENYAIPFFKYLNLTQINMGHIQKFYNQVAEKHKSVARLSKAVMNTSMEYAKERNLISVNPTLNVNLPKSIEEVPYRVLEIDVEKTLNIEQIKQLIEASKSTPIYLHILFALLMGLRKQEINGLKYSDIDYINRKLYLQRQLGVDPNKTKSECPKKTYTKQEIKLKSYSSERILDIPDMVFEAILVEKQKYEKNKSRRINDKHNPFLDKGYICCSTYGHPRSKGFHLRYYKKLLEENHLPKIKFHDLRHTYTTLLLMNNYNLKAVSQILGHASTVITANVYFDKDKITIDCNYELEDYIKRVTPQDKKIENNKKMIQDLDTNLAIEKYIGLS